MKKISILIIVVTLISGCSNQGETQKNNNDMQDTNGIIQLGVVVEDLEESLDFYTRIIGMKEVREFTVDGEFANVSGLSWGVPFTVKVLQLKEGDYSTNFKIMTFENLPEKPVKDKIQDAIGMQYITINVEKLNPYIKRIRKNNITLLGETPVQLDENRNFVLIKDPNNVFIELIGPME